MIEERIAELEHLVALLLVGRDIEFHDPGRGRLSGRVTDVQWGRFEVRVPGKREEFVVRPDDVMRVGPMSGAED